LNPFVTAMIPAGSIAALAWWRLRILS